mmetsp:Transcript_960/g.2492  ORF Transcript_960/g.2492 Transcript_960/m.2492 type:complete len:382 (+) Transcript_960:141-1286(+)
MASPDTSGEVLCRYYMHGVCRNGAECRFSHEIRTAPSMVCKFYLQGNCSYGDNCRYDHTRPDFAPKAQAPRPAPLPVVPRPDVDIIPAVKQLQSMVASSSLGDSGGHKGAAWGSYGEAAVAGTAFEINLPDNLDDLGISVVDDQEDSGGWMPPRMGGGVTDPAELPICSHYTAFGWCAKGENCPKIHGNLCEICNKCILHPYRPEEAAEHVAQCQLRKERAEAYLRGAEVECAICLEKVLSKPGAGAERKFGLMNCEHAFCLNCIRGWRSQHSGVDVDTALRTCPLCRTTTHFITPSSVWPSTAEEKARIINGYKAKLSSIDCRHFNRGNGTCPFGTSCFYRHMLPDGSLDEPTLRHFGNADGEVHIMKPVLLAHFMDLPQ